MCITKVLSSLPTIWKVFKWVVLAILVWFLFSALNNKFNILKPTKTVLQSATKGITNGVHAIGIGK